MNKIKSVFKIKVADKKEIFSNILKKNSNKSASKPKFNSMLKIAVITFVALFCTFVIFNLVPKYTNSSKNLNSINNDNDKNQQYVDYSKTISKDKIYASLNSLISDQTIKVGDTEVVYDFSDLVIIGTVIQKDQGTASELSFMPYTPGKIKVHKVIKGKIDQNTIDFTMSGGACTVADFIKASKKFPERIEKMELNKLSKKEKQEKYIVYNYKYQKNFEVGKNYVVMLAKNTNNSYFAISNAGFLDLDLSDFSNASISSKVNVDDINTKEDVLNLPNSIKLD